MLSKPENASHAEENPTSSSYLEMPLPVPRPLITVLHWHPSIVNQGDHDDQHIDQKRRAGHD